MEGTEATAWQKRAELAEKELAALRTQLAQFRPPAIFCCSREDGKHNETCRYSDKNCDPVAHLLHQHRRVARALREIMDIAYECLSDARMGWLDWRGGTGGVAPVVDEVERDLGEMGRFARYGQVVNGSHLLYQCAKLSLQEGPESFEKTVHRMLASAGCALWILAANCNECGNVHPPGLHPVTAPEPGAWEYAGIKEKAKLDIKWATRGVWPPGLGPEG